MTKVACIVVLSLLAVFAFSGFAYAKPTDQQESSQDETVSYQSQDEEEFSKNETLTYELQNQEESSNDDNQRDNDDGSDDNDQKDDNDDNQNDDNDQNDDDDDQNENESSRDDDDDGRNEEDCSEDDDDEDDREYFADEILEALGEKVGSIVLTLLRGLETLLNESEKINGTELEEILEIPSDCPREVDELFEGIASTVNKGESLNGRQVEDLLRVLDKVSILDLPLPQLVELAEHLDITEIVETEIERGLFTKATDSYESTSESTSDSTSEATRSD